MEQEIIQFDIPSLAFFMKTVAARPGIPFRGQHWHNAVEMVRVNRGEVICHIGGQTEILTPGSLLLINSRTNHRMEAVGEGEICYIQVDIRKYTKKELPARMGYIEEFIPRSHANPYGIFSGDNEILQLFDRMRQEVTEKSDAYERYIKAYIYQLVAFAHRQGILSDTTILPNEELMKIVAFIDSNYPYKLSLQELANLIKWDKYRLCREFKAMTGSTVVEYINFVRLRKAEDLLTHTGQSISETAYACGFTSIQYFNKVFQKYMGCSPSTFKKWLKAE